MLVSISERLLEVGRERSDTAPDAAAALAALVDWHVDFALRHRALIVVQDRDWESLPEDAREQVRTLQREYVDVWAARLREVHDGLRARQRAGDGARGVRPDQLHPPQRPAARRPDARAALVDGRIGAGDLLELAACVRRWWLRSSPRSWGSAAASRPRSSCPTTAAPAGLHVQRPAAPRHPPRGPGLHRRGAAGRRLRQQRRAARQRRRQQRQRRCPLPALGRLLRDDPRPGGRGHAAVRRLPRPVRHPRPSPASCG